MLGGTVADRSEKLKLIKRIAGKTPPVRWHDPVKIDAWADRFFDLVQNVPEKLALIRPFTGDNFKPVKGYDARKPMSLKRLKIINKYYHTTTDLTSRSYDIIVPKSRDKKEVFNYSGQVGFNKFVKAIIHTPDKEASYEFAIEPERPEGSRFVTRNKRTGETSWHIPPEAFEDNTGEFDQDNEHQDAEFIQQVLEDYAQDANVFLINAGDFHMWGSAGGAHNVANKIAQLRKQYGGDYFNPYDKNSHHIDNWFRGVTAYSASESVGAYIEERAIARAKRLHDKGLPITMTVFRLRLLQDGSIGLYIDGYQIMRFTVDNLPLGINWKGRNYTVRKYGGNSITLESNGMSVASVYLDSGYDTA